jgi:hypothetical protein
MLSCDNCAKVLKNPKHCGGCRKVHYCNRGCQTKHWKSGHKKTCQAYKNEKHRSNDGIENVINLRKVGKEVCCDGHYIFDSKILNLPQHTDIINEVLSDCEIWSQVGSGSMYGKVKTNLNQEHKSIKALHQQLDTFANKLRETHSLLYDMLHTSAGTMGIMIDDNGLVSQEHVVQIRKPKGARACLLYPAYACQTVASISHFKDSYPIPIKTNSDIVMYNCDSLRTKIKIHLKKKVDRKNYRKRRIWIGLFQFFYPINEKNAVSIQDSLESYYPTNTRYLKNDVNTAYNNNKNSELDGSKVLPECKIDVSNAIYYDNEFIERKKDVYDELCKNFTTQLGFKASHSSRKSTLESNPILRALSIEGAEKDSSFKYGEILFRPLAISLQKIQYEFNGLKHPGKEIFVDLGSGTGKPCIAAALMYPFKKVIGIEVLKDLCSLSSKLKLRYDNYFKTNKTKTEVEYICEDIVRTTCWYDADIVFCNSLIFNKELCNKIADMAVNLKPGAFFISSGNINNPKYGKETTNFEKYFTSLDYKFLPYSWGLSSVYIHRRNCVTE